MTRGTSLFTVQTKNYSAPTKISVGAATTVILAANASRAYLAIVNDSDEVVYIAIGANAVMNSGIRLNPNGGVLELTETDVPTQAVNGICASGGKNVTVQEAV